MTDERLWWAVWSVAMVAGLIAAILSTIKLFA